MLRRPRTAEHAANVAAANKRRARPLTERFWEKVSKKGDDECWLWCGAANSGGYGFFVVSGGAQRTVAAHRMSWQLAHNVSLTSVQLVCHSCDTPLCVNPKHLFLGDAGSNMQDRARKGRGFVKGTAHAQAKLTEDQVRLIRRRLTDGSRGEASSLARELGVSPATICNIHKGRSYRDVT